MARKRITALPDIPRDATPTLRRWMEAMKEATEVRLGRRGDPGEAAVTFNDLVDSGLVQGLGRINPLTGLPTVLPVGDGGDLATPPRPTGVYALGVFDGIHLLWDFPGSRYQIRVVEIRRGQTNDFNESDVLGSGAGASYFDVIPGEEAQTFWYWLRFVNAFGTVGPWSEAVSATKIADIGYLIERLTEEIDASYLAEELRKEIELISNFEPGSVNSRLKTETDARVQAILEEHQDRVKALQAEAKARQQAVSAEAKARADALVDEAKARTAAIEANREAWTAETESLARETESLRSTAQGLGSEIDSVRQASVKGDEALARTQETLTAASNKAFADLATERQARINGLNALTTSFESQIAQVAEDYEAAILEERTTRIQQGESLARDLGQLSARVDTNVADITREEQTRASAISALSSAVESITARLDATPVWVSSFEDGADYDRWNAPGGATISAYTADDFGGEQSAAIGYSGSNPSSGGATGGVNAQISESMAQNFSEKRIRVTGYAKRFPTDSQASSEFAVAYSTAEVGNSGWQRFPVEDNWTLFEFLWDVPGANNGGADYLGIWGDTSNSGKKVLIDLISIQPATTEEDLPAITAAINEEASARVAGDQANTQQINTAKSQFNSAIAEANLVRETEVKRVDDRVTSVSRKVDTTRNALEGSIATTNSRLVSEVKELENGINAASGKIDTVESRLGDTIGDVQSELNSETKRLDGRINTTSKKIDTTRSQLEGKLSTAQTELTSEIEKVDNRVTSTSRSITNVRNELKGDVSGVRNSLNSEVKELEDSIKSTNTALTKAQSQIGKDVAAVETKLGTEVGKINGELTTLNSYWYAKVQTNGLIGGFVVGNNGDSIDAIFDVDRFAVGRTSKDARKPFIIAGGDTYINSALIAEASIQEGQLGPITIGKLTKGDGTPITTVGGLIRADAIEVNNLDVRSAARFSGDVFSDNFQSGKTGWAILQSGYVEFNDAMIRGNLEVQSITVNGQSPFGALRLNDNDERRSASLAGGGNSYGHRDADYREISASHVATQKLSKMPSGSRLSLTSYPRVAASMSGRYGSGSLQDRTGDGGDYWVGRTGAIKWFVRVRIRTWIDGKLVLDKSHTQSDENKGSRGEGRPQPTASHDYYHPKARGGYNMEYKYDAYRSTSTIKTQTDISVKGWVYNGGLGISFDSDGGNITTGDVFRLG
ncbi:hypothetical protein [Cobetia sp. 1AS1]|uniref:phage tail tip fiber protein n=1 Tax=Cobetia sp. 1AS1 TaxID=3040016 RepID=UPI00244A2B96|nr:hypothetical protein [Cobetia sp. 1AS1]MDH2296008.1 hypothetical protein [Cobetia sp. 1AS1]